MLNVFYLYALIWIVILILYSLGWSDMCISLSGEISSFIIIMIITSLIIGYKKRRIFRFDYISKNPHNSYLITFVLLFLYIINFIYGKSIPLLVVLKGNSLASSNFKALPLFFIVSGISMLYCYYLFYLFLIFKKKSLLMELFIINSMFILLYQRQYIMFLLVGYVLLFLSYFFGKTKKISKRIIVVLFVFCIGFVGLYFFGIMGNMRYGIWDKNDSSMIVELGKINQKYPSWLPKEYAWSYIYLVSPLANFQHNYILSSDSLNILGMLHELLPNYFSKYLSLPTSDNLLLVDGLTVCTAYSSSLRYFGILGPYIVFSIEVLLLLLVINMYRETVYKTPVLIGLSYFFLMSFFDNPIVFDNTSLMIAIPIILYIFRYLSPISKHFFFQDFSKKNNFGINE